MKIGERHIGRTATPFLIAEMSGNYKPSLDRVLARMPKRDPKSTG